jgi:hypothetical protein
MKLYISRNDYTPKIVKIENNIIEYVSYITKHSFGNFKLRDLFDGSSDEAEITEMTKSDFFNEAAYKEVSLDDCIIYGY